MPSAATYLPRMTSASVTAAWVLGCIAFVSGALWASLHEPDLDYSNIAGEIAIKIGYALFVGALTAAVVDVRSRVNELLDAIPLLAPNIEHSDRQHAAIVTAILAGDPAGARRTMAEHLAGTAALLRGFLT